MMETVTDYFKQNPNMSGLLISAIGILLFVGALFKWSWVLSPNKSRRSLLRTIFGPRGEMFISSSIMIIAGVVIFIFV